MKHRSSPLTNGVALFTFLACLSACEADKPVKCRYVGQVQLPETAATQLVRAQLLPAGEGFVLAGLEESTVHWASLSRAGTLGAASSFALSEPVVLGPQLATTGRSTPGDQLLAIYGTTATDGQLLIRVVSQTAGQAAQAPVTLATLPAGTNAQEVQFSVGSARAGAQAVLAWGLPNQTGTKIQAQLLGANAAPVGALLSMDPMTDWRCLQVVPSRSQWAVSWVRTPTTGDWRFMLEEGLEVGTVVSRYTVGLGTSGLTCPLVTPTTRGYALSYQTQKGTWVADYDIERGNVSPQLVAATARFGTPDEQPLLGGVVSAGLDIAVVFSLVQGPQVWLFDAFGRRSGDPLKLPANVGQAGMVASWPATEGLHATYREGVDPATPTAASGPRWFMKVECPGS